MILKERSLTMPRSSDLSRSPRGAARRSRGLIWDRKGKVEYAFVDYDAAVQLEPDSALHRNARGSAWQRKGNLEKALADYDEAIRLDPKYASARSNRGLAWEQKGNLQKARADFEAAFRLAPDSESEAANLKRIQNKMNADFRVTETDDDD